MKRIWAIPILIAACLALSAGCTQILPSGEGVSTPTPATTPEATESITDDRAPEPENAVPGPSGINAATDLAIWAENGDWDLSPGEDGFLIHFRFLDDQGREVSFSGQSLSARLVVRTPPTNTRNVPITPRVLYDGGLTISSSEEGAAYPLRGIRLAYDRINLRSTDRGVGSITLTATLPNGRVLSDTETYLFPR